MRPSMRSSESTFALRFAQTSTRRSSPALRFNPTPTKSPRLITEGQRHARGSQCAMKSIPYRRASFHSTKGRAATSRRRRRHGRRGSQGAGAGRLSIKRNTSGTTRRFCLLARPRCSSNSRSWANPVEYDGVRLIRPYRVRRLIGRPGPNGKFVLSAGGDLYRTACQAARHSSATRSDFASSSAPHAVPCPYSHRRSRSQRNASCRTPLGTASSPTSRTGGDGPTHPQAVAVSSKQ